MKIAISATDGNIEAPYAPNFGRAAYFVLMDTDTDTWQAVANPGMSASGGAGVQAAQLVINQGAQAVISGSFGPHAYQALEAAGLPMYLAPAGIASSVRQLVDWFKAGRLHVIGGPTNAAGHGATGQAAQGKR